MFEGSLRAAGHTLFTLPSLIHPSPGSCSQTVENCTFGINESAIANHMKKRKLKPKLSQQYSRFLGIILWYLCLSYLSHLIQTLSTFNSPYGTE